ncbi:hypothetical protein RRG08_035490 [Elysia crispata]|uniref:Uncharacterized protein n=1 Tax=Elysia crispata TaxID=231223 RepID=A0AAE1E2X0_9GAST|nr:hypothetical protein RRG08_035490 [Elysia crispata]
MASRQRRGVMPEPCNVMSRLVSEPMPRRQAQLAVGIGASHVPPVGALGSLLKSQRLKITFAFFLIIVTVLSDMLRDTI